MIRFAIKSTCILLLMLLAVHASYLVAQEPSSGPWVMQNSGTTEDLRGIHSVGGGIVWASGTHGTVLRTEDSGYMWQSCAMPPGAEKLDFRGIWAWDADTAVVMSSGPGDLSRIYKTTDGCSHWKLLYTNPEKGGFFDAVAFWDRNHGVVLGDLVRGSFQILTTEDGGIHWATRGCAPPLPLEAGEDKAGAFAASNSSMALGQPPMQKLSFGTGGARIYHWVDQPRSTCSRTHVPLAGQNDSSGIFSLVFRDNQHGLAVGGDYKKPIESKGTAAWTADGGAHWAASTSSPHGYRSTAAWDPETKAWIAAGTNGSDVSYDDGKTWQSLDDGNWNALSLPWVIGPKGRIAKLGELKRRK
jgi:photosystem II stability/assembly factor-like uncharacterized protein